MTADICGHITVIWLLKTVIMTVIWKLYDCYITVIMTVI